MRLVHLSDIHIWRYTFNPLRMINKRALGMASLLSGRARRFRLERIEEVVARVISLDADHILITGDLTTTALPEEFHDAIKALAPLLADPSRVTVLPGNHDRYTGGSSRSRTFEKIFGDFMPKRTFPWIRRLDDETMILGLDPTRPHLSATGKLPAKQLAEAQKIWAELAPKPRRLIVACHYPVLAPASHEGELIRKRLINPHDLSEWLTGLGPHLYCCGHVHAAWAYRPEGWPDHLCLNSGAPLLRDSTGLRSPGFLEITLAGADVTVMHHAWRDHDWTARVIHQNAKFFARS